MNKPDCSKQPSFFGQSERHFQSAPSMASLKVVNVQFDGYGLLLNEEVLFPSMDQLESKFGNYVKLADARAGSKNKSAYILVTKKLANGSEKQTWFNMAFLNMECYNSDGDRENIDDLRDQMRLMNDASDRLTAVAGKILYATGTKEAFARKFVDGKPVMDQVEPRTYVTCAIRDNE